PKSLQQLKKWPTKEKTLSEQADNILQSLEDKVNTDLAFRDRVVKKFNPPLSLELFLFGRPLFQLLQAFGVAVSESPQGLKLIMRRKFIR
ncbi:MAG: hypothetical protein KJ985_11645, partial [Proteobacteria bacterium]|nr:hypothetical protein [Pseudomonadota bacterium]